MKQIRMIPSIQALVAIVLLGVSSLATAERQPLDRVIAVVEQGVVLQSELDARLEQIRSRLRAQGTRLPPDEVMKQRVLEQLIMDEIQVQRAEQMGMRVSDSELNQTMRNIASRNNYSLDEFEQALASEGLTFQQAREQIRQEILVSRIQQQQVGQRVRVTDREVDNYLESAAGRERSGVEYLLGHILITVNNFNNEDEVQRAEERARDIQQRISDGADFREMAVAESDGRAALEGGELGWRREEQLPSLAAGVIPDLDVEEPSEVLQSGSGFHIVTPLDRRGGAEQEVEQSRVQHILISDEQRSEQESEALVREIEERLDAGESFEALAREYSDDPGSAPGGGDLGWVSPGEMVPEFEQTMQETEVGERSMPFRSQFGWHLLQVEDRRMEDIGQEIQRNEARQTLQQRQFELELQNWLREIREEAYVDVKIVINGLEGVL